MIQRDLEQEIQKYLFQGKAIVIYGARQVGKTTLLHKLFDKEKDILWLNGEEEETQANFSHASSTQLEPVAAGHEIVIIDEAQKIRDIGTKLKILQDNFGKDTQFIATGSSSFDLANKLNEPMTGRKWTFWLPAPSIHELVNTNGLFQEHANLPLRLLYGSYPAVVTNITAAKKTLSDLTTENLYRDVLNFGEIIKADKLRDVLQALAFQVGSQVSMNELGNIVQLDRKTVEKYIALLEQSFIIFKLPSFSRNLRNELKSSRKIYFYDNGIRNALINDFRPLDARQDVGALFENYIISEFKKSHINDNLYFWRNKSQQEIDLLIEKDGVISAIEVKYNARKSAKFPKTFIDTYAPASTQIINQDNYLEHLNQQPVD